MLTNEITAEQVQALNAQSETTLAAWWCALNRWEWPSELPGDPGRPVRYEAGDNRSQVMRWINNKIGHKAVLRYHNRDMSDEVFESFWRDERDEGTPYGDYRKARTDEWMKRHEARQEAILSADVVLDDPLDADEIYI